MESLAATASTSSTSTCTADFAEIEPEVAATGESFDRPDELVCSTTPENNATVTELHGSVRNYAIKKLDLPSCVY